MKLFSLGGTEVRLHWMTLLFCGVWILSGQAVTWLLVSLIILLHEGAHALCAFLLQVRVYRITLYPFGGAASMEEELEQHPAAEFLIAAAGPLFTAALGFAWQQVPLLAHWQPDFIRYSVSVACFNLIPLLPLDGGRMVKSTLRLLGMRRPEKGLALCGVIGGAGMTIVSLYRLVIGIGGSFSVMGFFLLIAAARELRASKLYGARELLKREQERLQAREVRVLLARPEDSTAAVASRFHGSQYWYVLVQDEKENSLGLISEKAVMDKLLYEDVHAMLEVCPASPEGKGTRIG